MKAKSAIAKGKKYEKYLLGKFRDELDAHAYQPAGSGNGTEKGDIFVPKGGLVVECKNHKKLSVLDWWDQTKSQALGDVEPVLIMRNPRYAEFRENLVLIDLEYFLELQKGNQGSVEVNPHLTYDQKSALSSMKNSISRVLKSFK